MIYYMPYPNQEQSICLYRSLKNMLNEFSGIHLQEKDVFFLSHGFDVKYNKNNWQQPIYTNLFFNDYTKALSNLASFAGVSYQQRFRDDYKKNIHELNHIFNKGQTVLLITDIKALRYDLSYRFRGDAVHCIRLTSITLPQATFIDDYVAGSKKGIQTKIGSIDLDKNEKYLHGYAFINGILPHDDWNELIIRSFYQNLHKLSHGSSNPSKLTGIQAMHEFINDFKYLYDMQLTEKFYLELLTVIQYQLSPAFHYLCQAVNFLPYPHFLNARAESIANYLIDGYESLHLFYTTGNRKHLNQLITDMKQWIDSLQSLINSLIISLERYFGTIYCTC